MVLTLSALAFVVFKDHLENEIVLGILGVLAMVGIFFLVSAIIGFIEVMPQSRQSELAHAFLDGHPDGTLITDRKGHGDLCQRGLWRTDRLKECDRRCSRWKRCCRAIAESNQALYRLANLLARGQGRV